MTGKHSLDGLTRHSELPCDVGLRHTRFDDAVRQLRTLAGELMSRTGMMDSLFSHLLAAVEDGPVHGEVLVVAAARA